MRCKIHLEMLPEEIKKQIVDALDDAKARDICVMDVRCITDITDYMIVASGTSNRHVMSVADKVIESIRNTGNKPLGVEGENIGEWVLIDFGDVIVHVMQPVIRDYYQLEKLWATSAVDGIIDTPSSSAPLD